MKVSELQGALLDYWVARAEGHEVRLSLDMTLAIIKHGEHGLGFAPSGRWSEGGPIIERERIAFRITAQEIVADCMTGDCMGIGTGPTHLIAAMRAFVASRFGDEVPDVD